MNLLIKILAKSGLLKDDLDYHLLRACLLSSTEANQSASMSHVTIGKAVCSRIAAAFGATLLVAGPTRADTKKIPVLRIGTTETVVEEDAPEDSEDTAVQDIYRQFIQAETGFGSDIVALENHEVLAERLASGKLQLGLFMGYEFAWAQARHPQLKVLAVGVNEHSYRYPTLVVRRDGPASAFADLRGKTLALPRSGQGHGLLFAVAQSRLEGQDPGAFLGPIDSFEDAETPLDEVVDGIQEVAVVDRLGLEVPNFRHAADLSALLTSALLLLRPERAWYPLSKSLSISRLRNGISDYSSLVRTLLLRSDQEGGAR
jgi:ABC-type phosphate/phosphonate transport system substrate-binding protein